MERQAFKVGDAVEWYTHSFTTGFLRKVGVVSAVIPCEHGAVTKKVMKARFPSPKYRWETRLDCPRKHESYLITVNRIGLRKPRVYWPRVKQLKPHVTPMQPLMEIINA